MYEIDFANNILVRLKETNLRANDLREKAHLQQYIVNSWDEIRNDLLIPSAIFLGQGLFTHASVNDSLDILAYDQSDSKLIVIELKRDSNKLQLLQSLSYSAMVATWDSEKLMTEVNKNPIISEEARDFCKSYETNPNIKTIMIAEYFDPEVIITSDWLCTSFNLEISAFKLDLHEHENKLLCDFTQRYPLAELEASYEARRRQSQTTTVQNTWDEVIKNCDYTFAKEAIEYCKSLKGEGDPNHKRFLNVIVGFESFSFISFLFRNKYINIYTMCEDKERSSNLVKNNIRNDIEVSYWRDGISFQIGSSDDFAKLMKWFK